MQTLRLALVLTTICAFHIDAMDFTATGSLYEAGYKGSNVQSVECWFKVDPQCPEGAYVFDKLVESDRSAFRLEVDKQTIRLINTAGDAIEAPLPPAGTLIHAVALIDKNTDPKKDPAALTQSLYLNGALVKSMPFSTALAVSRQDGPLRVGGDLAGQHRFIGSVARVSVYSRPLKDNELALGPEVPTNLAGKLGWGETGRWDFSSPAADGSIPSPAQPNGVEPATAMTVARVFPVSTAPAEKGLALWYSHPAWEWTQALPIGNGRIGGMIFGGVDTEKIQLNEGTIWAGGPYDSINPKSFETLGQVRALLLEGKSADAIKAYFDGMMSIPKNAAELPDARRAQLQIHAASGSRGKLSPLARPG